MISSEWLLSNNFRDLGYGLWEYKKEDWIEYDLNDYTVCINEKWLEPKYKFPEELNNLVKTLTGESIY